MDYINIKLIFHFYILKSNLRRNIYLHNYDEIGAQASKTHTVDVYYIE